MKTAAHKKPGKMETRISMAVLALLVVVGAGVLMRQSEINPAVVALRPESHGREPSRVRDEPALIDTTGSEITPFSPPERFNADTLYEKINGRADLYLSSGFVSLNTQRFALKNDAASAWVEVFIYDMGTPENAFSVFSMQRRTGARATDGIPNGYRTDNAVFMAHARFYLELIGTDASEDLQRAVNWLAGAFAESHGGAATARAPGAGLFPEAGLAADSLRLIAANAFGYGQLNRIYRCDYLIDGIRLTAFVSEREDGDAASALAADYSQTLLSYGAIAVAGPVPIEGAAAMQFFDTHEIVFSRGRYLAGVHEAGSLEAAITLAERLAAHLEKL
ncbi:DUF6599 family protein [Desulfosarcina alkanivorans]|nr:DUF6599 family protein [Desulfosarcina alkanivorans]